MVKVVSVKFKTGSKPYYFAAGDKSYEKGTGVIVETSKGLEYATVCESEREIDEAELVTPLKPVIRAATDKDVEQMNKNAARHDECLKIAQEKIDARGLDMKPVDCEISFDGSKITIYFSAEHRVDFRDLIRDLSSAYHMRIELRQINIREEIQRLGGLAPCGRECCCSGCFEEPVKVSVKMAKNQGLSLNPQKISGLCGRLMCCLSYENDYYCEVCKKVPKLGSEAETPDGTGTVINVNMLKMICKVKFENGDNISYRDYAVDEIRFKRGNVLMGKTDDDDDKDVIEEQDGEKITAPEPEKAFDDRRNRRPQHDKIDGDANGRGDGARGNKQNGGKNFKNGNKNGGNRKFNQNANGQTRNEGNRNRNEDNRNRADGGQIRENGGQNAPRKNKHKRHFKPKSGQPQPEGN